MAFAAENKQSIQLAARNLRYKWFEELRQTHHFSHIATAHHAGDQVETVLHHLVRGAGLRGLGGMKIRSENHILRPLLFFSKNDLLAILQREGLAWREDSSNSSVKYARNLLRQEVIPILKTINPNIEQTIGQNAIYWQESQDLLAWAAQEWKNKLTLITEKGHLKIELSDLKKLPFARVLLYEWLLLYHFTATQLDDILTKAQNGALFYSETHIAEIHQNKLIIQEATQKESQGENAFFEEKITESTSKLNFKENNFDFIIDKTDFILKYNDFSTKIPLDKLYFPLVLRQLKKGDRFKPSGKKGKRKLVSDFLKDTKISRLERSNSLVLCNGDTEILAIFYTQKIRLAEL